MTDLTKLQLSEKEKEPLFVDDVFQKEVFDKMNEPFFIATNAEFERVNKEKEAAQDTALKLLAETTGLKAKDIAVLFD